MTWEPIETAPRDVRILLGKIGEKVVAVATIDAEDPGLAWTDGRIAPYPCDATHWMPMPDGPREPQEGKTP